MDFGKPDDIECRNAESEPIAKEMAEIAHGFVSASGNEIWSAVGPGLFEQLNEATNGGLTTPEGGKLDIKDFVESPLIKGIFCCGMANGFTNAVLILKRMEKRARQVRESN